MEQFQTWFDLINTAVRNAISNGDWEKFAAYGACAMAFFYGAFYGVKKGTYAVGYACGTAWSGCKSVYRFISPEPVPPPEPSQLCQFILEALNFEDMVYDDKSKDLLLCGPVTVKLCKGTAVIDSISVEQDDPWPHLSSLDRTRVADRVAELVGVHYKMKDRDTVQRMVNSVTRHMRSNRNPLKMPHPWTGGDKDAEEFMKKLVNDVQAEKKSG